MHPLSTSRPSIDRRPLWSPSSSNRRLDHCEAVASVGRVLGDTDERQERYDAEAADRGGKREEEEEEEMPYPSRASENRERLARRLDDCLLLNDERGSGDDTPRVYENPRNSFLGDTTSRRSCCSRPTRSATELLAPLPRCALSPATARAHVPGGRRGPAPRA